MCPRSRHRSRLAPPWMGLRAGMFRNTRFKGLRPDQTGSFQTPRFWRR
jgi:hypothetical protein